MNRIVNILRIWLQDKLEGALRHDHHDEHARCCCGHYRYTHCGCGKSCFNVKCECRGFVERP